MRVEYNMGMSTQIAVRLHDDELALLDLEVASGRATSRSDAVRRSLSLLDRNRGYQRDKEIIVQLSQNGQVLYPDFERIPAGDLAEFD